MLGSSRFLACSVVAALAFSGPPVSAVEVGECICHEGFIMDQYCIDRVTLFDNPSVKTLENPGVHTIHCLLDVAQCINSGYTVLGDPVGADGGMHTVAYKFDADGDKLMTELAIASGAVGACNECTGETAQMTAGLRATVIGRVAALGNAVSSDPIKRAHSLYVTEVLASSTGCVGYTCPETTTPTVAPNEAAVGESDCNDFVSSIELSSSPSVTFEFTVNLPDTETNAVLSAVEVAAGGSLKGRITYEGNGWVSIGPSQKGQMVGGEVIICLPEDADVSKYGPMTSTSLTGVQKMPEANQTLIKTSVTQEGGITVCEFTKLLVEEGETPITEGVSNSFIWAVGSSNDLGYHPSRSSADIVLEACTSEGVQDVEFVQGSTETYDSYWKAHGITMALAWGFCAPVAVAAALARSFIPGNGLWFKIHEYMNAICCVFTFVSFFIAVAAYNKASTPHFGGTHQKVGLAVFIIVLLQVLGGALRPHLPAADAPVKDPVEPQVDFASEQAPPKKSKKRTGWEIGHKLMGAALLGLGVYNGHSGAQLYALRTPSLASADAWTTAWWAWLGVLLGFSAVLKITDIVRSRHS